MAKVRLLEDELVNKIAAGEVVERPASVVKELVENAIDAGATHIKVSLKDGGRQMIHVLDDGSGMEEADAILAMKRHTTSKLSHADDLFQVQTMGFRGEALASISAVSRFTLQTRAAEADAGTRIVMEEGTLQVLPWQGPRGTSMTINDLFYNVPVRKAFMKTSAAEFAACHEYMQALALSMPHIGFTLLHNDKEIFSVGALPAKTPGLRGEESLRLRAQAVFGKESIGSLIYVHKVDRYARIEGLISAPGQDKGSAKYLFTFVNQRWVRDKLVRNGVMRGYHSHLLRGKFPIAFLYIDIEPSLVDVNVHPAKAELRFQYGNEVQNSIAVAIRETLRTSSWAEAPDTPRDAVAGRRTPPPAEMPLPEDFDLLLGASPPVPKLESQTLLEAEQVSSPVQDVSPARAGASARSEDKSIHLAPPTPAETGRVFDRNPPLERSAASPRPDAPLVRPAVTDRSSEVKRTTMSFDRWPGAPKSEGRSITRSSSDVASRAPVPPSPPAIPRELPFPSMPRIESAPSTSGKMSASASSALGVMRDREKESGSVIPWDELQYIGAFARCFLLFEYREQMLAVDQHAFHERVLYERLSRNPELLVRTQPLLMPEVLSFSPGEVAELKEQQTTFGKWGLHYEVVSDSEIELRAVPSLLMHKDLASLVHDLLRGARGTKEMAHDVLATLACHAAVRAGEDLPEAELKVLLKEASTVDFYHNCPHGRRVFRWWKQSQVAAWFDRLG